MPKFNLYQRYLAADQITKRMESVGAQPGYFIFHDAGHIEIGLAYNWSKGGSYDTPESREQAVNDFLAKYPDSTVTREKNYSDKPQMVVSGETNVGIKWQIDFRDGVCERVQVGTKPVETYDPTALLNIPKITVEEPVYEYRCPPTADPIFAAGLIAS